MASLDIQLSPEDIGRLTREAESNYERSRKGLPSDRIDVLTLEQAEQAMRPNVLTIEQVEAIGDNPLAVAGKALANYSHEVIRRIGETAQNLPPEFPFSQELRSLGSAQNEMIPPDFEMPPDPTFGQKAGMIAGHLGGAVVEIGGTARAFVGAGVPGWMANIAAFSSQSAGHGGSIAEGGAMGAAFAALEAIPAASFGAKAAKVAVESGAMAGITAAGGGDWQEVLINALIPPALKGSKAAASKLRTRLSEAQTAKDVVEAAAEANSAVQQEATSAEPRANMARPAEELTPLQEPNDARRNEPVPKEVKNPVAEAGQEAAQELRPQGAQAEVVEGQAAEGVKPAAPPKLSMRMKAAEEAAKKSDVELEPNLGIVASPGEKLRSDRIPGPIQADIPEVEQRMQNARGVERESIFNKIKDVAESAWHKVTRAQEHIPNTPKFAVANETFRLLKAIPESAKDQVNRNVAAIIDPMGPNQLRLFERSLMTDNMIASLERGEPLRFGFGSRQEVEAYKAKLDKLVAETPEVQRALETRRKVAEEIVREQVEHGLLPEEALQKTAEYYHQQVLSYLDAPEAGRAGKSLRRNRKTYQGKRVKDIDSLPEEFDYNTSYIEAETSWMADAAVNVAKEKALRTIASKYDIMPQLRTESKVRDIELDQLIRDKKDYAIWQPEPGNVFYRAATIPEKIAEQLQMDIVKEIGITKEMLGKVLAMGGKRQEMFLPKEIVDQLNAAEKPKPVGKVAGAAQALMRGWKVWTLLNPKRALGYMIRNVTGDIDPLIAGAPEALKNVPRAIKELDRYYRGQRLSLSSDLKKARDLGVISSGLTAEEIPDVKDLAVFRRFYKSRISPASIPANYFEIVKNFNEFRESTLRYATYLHYKDALQSGTLNHYGGAKKGIVEALKRDMGIDVAAAHVSRKTMGDYGDVSVAGDWVRKNAIPFYSWMEVNATRYPKIIVNAAKAGDFKSGAAAAAAVSAAALLRVGALYATLWAWNNLVRPDEEEDLGNYDRANPHINLGRTPDGSVRVMRNVGAVGDLLEWFGLNTLASLWPQYQAGQITATDLLAEMAKDPLNKVVGGIRPDVKGVAEVLSGQSYFPDATNPRSVERGEAAAGVFGLVDEYKAAKGKLTGSGERARPNYLARAMVGVVDPKRNALNDTYDLREKFLKKEGHESPNFKGTSAFKNIREAAMAQDYNAFKAALKAYYDSGKGYDNFKKSLNYLDPIAQRLNADDELKFEKFLTANQRKRVAVARQYAQDLKVTLWAWAKKAKEEGIVPGKKKLSLEP